MYQVEITQVLWEFSSRFEFVRYKSVSNIKSCNYWVGKRVISVFLVWNKTQFFLKNIKKH